MRITSQFGANCYEAGNPWFICDECGFKYRRSEIMPRWDNALVCADCWEPRHPQEAVRGRVDKIAVINPRPDAPRSAYVEYLKDANGDYVLDASGNKIEVVKGWVQPRPGLGEQPQRYLMDANQRFVLDAQGNKIKVAE